MYTIGVIGAGNMAMAIINGALKNKLIKKEEIALTHKSEEKRVESRKNGFVVLDSSKDIMEQSKMVLFGIKPQDFTEVFNEIESYKKVKGQLILSIAAAISSDYLKKYLSTDAKIVNIMPNTPLMIGKGATAISKCKNCSDNDIKLIVEIFESLGEVALVDEKDLIPLTPANGSSPAFVYYFVDAIASAVAKRGVDKNLALKMTAKGFAGAAEMLFKSDKSPKELIAEVSTEGGLTIEAIKVFDEKDIYGIVDCAVENLINRANDLAK